MTIGHPLRSDFRSSLLRRILPERARSAKYEHDRTGHGLDELMTGGDGLAEASGLASAIFLGSSSPKMRVK
jgi:hypothetical protein